jgi:chromosome condensin MukBEF MukE localization factor
MRGDDEHDMQNRLVRLGSLMGQQKQAQRQKLTTTGHDQSQGKEVEPEPKHGLDAAAGAVC